MIKADVLITNKNWKKYIRTPLTYINRRLKKIDKKTNLFKNKNCNFSLLLAGSAEVKKLNIKFRKKNKTTDILSFPFHERKNLKKLLKKNNKIYLGDIIINLNKVKNVDKKKNFILAFDKIWVHGLAHLLGHRHKSNIDFSIMKKIENRLLQSIK
jgi:probable rRNA maturation factor